VRTKVRQWWKLPLIAALAFVITIIVVMSVKTIFGPPRGRPSVVYVERKDGHSVVYTFSLKSRKSKKIFSTPYEVLDVLVKDGRYYFATPFNISSEGKNTTLLRNCEGKNVICKFGFVNGNLAYRRAQIKPLSDGYSIEITSYVLNKEFRLVDSYTATHPYLSSVMGLATRMSFDFDEGFISLARSSISISNYLYAGNPGYSGFFTADGGNLIRYDRDGNEHILPEGWEQQDCFMKWSPGIFKKGEPNKYLVFKAEMYDIAFDARASFNGYPLRDNFYIVKHGEDCQQTGVILGDRGNLTVIPGKHKIIARSANRPFVIYNLSGFPIHTFSDSVTLVGFVRF